MLPAAMIAAGCAVGSHSPGGAGSVATAQAADDPADAGPPAHLRRLQIARQRDLLGKDIAVLREGNLALLEEIEVLRDDLRRIGLRPPELPDSAAAAAGPASVGPATAVDEPAAADEIERRLREEVSRRRALRDAELTVRQELLKFRLHLRNELKLRGAEPVRPQ